MANTQISITNNGTTTLATAGKYCDRNIDINVEVQSLDSTVKEFTQMNDKVAQYLAAADASYTDSNGSSVSVIADYETAEGDADRPLGYPLTATSGNIYLQNEDSGNGWKLSVGTDVIRSSVLNAVPNDVSQYLVKDANGNLLENGRIKPTGKVRMIRFCGFVRNCRDLGGWACDGGTVNYGKLFRSAVVHTGETWIDPQIGQNIGINHHIDFRSDAEANYITESSLGALVRYQRTPLNLYYADIIDPTQADYENAKKVFRTIIDAAIHGEGVIYNCSLGRDRTGTITFMLLALLGVARADIDKDYELSSFSGYNSPNIQSARRTRTDYQEMATYLATLGGSTLRDNVVWWFLNAGFTLSELNAFRSAMASGTPDELSASDFIIEHTITNTLTGCTTSNPAVSAVDGTSYTANLAFVDGYNTFSYVTVKMGGVDVTANVYSNGVINIPSVTGDVIITAVATHEFVGTNLVTTSEALDSTAVYNGIGYKNGSYISSSSGGDGSKSGHVTTGMIAYPNVVGGATPPAIYVRGGSIDRLGLYFEDKSFKGTLSAGGLTTDPFTTEQLATNYYKYTPVMANGNSKLYVNYGAIRYIRLDVVCTDGASLIVTLDEPIE